ncbi:MAG: DUF4876 domain-containing protein [Candidatus Marinimicrobia bacterium]|nr:DUF4876 domain-containing protein [Candidatus Neomarinimicrobiota bacterium]
MKKYPILLVLIITISCALIVPPPDSMRFSLELTLIDTTATGSDSLVQEGQVILQSITYGDEYEGVSNTEGKVLFENLLPDSYNILATGNRVSGTDVILINGQLQDTSLFIANNDTILLRLMTQTSRSSALLISEIYYTGAASIIPQYFHDQFTEIYNNSTEVIYLDSLLIADVEFGFIDDSLLHAVHAYMFPGDGNDYPIQPGELIVIAQDAIDHSPNPVNSINLLNADFEYYVADKGDVNNPNVTDMIQIHHKYGIDFLYSVMNNAVILMDVNNPYAYGYDEFNRILLPKNRTVDGVEYRDNTSEMDHKRVDATIDAGLTGGIASYSSQSVERKIERWEGDRMILMDNNNSSLDFKINNPPTPGWVEEATE